MKIFMICVMSIFVQVLHGQNSEEIKIPKGVTYNYCDNKVNEQAKRLIKESLSDSSKYLLCQENLIIGPQLWKRYNTINRINEIEGGNITFHVDDQQLSGKLIQTLADAMKVWDEFRKEVQGDYVIRKANEQELIYYWSVISFDIDEPLLIIQTKDHNYILNILKETLKLMWLDEAPVKKSYYNPIDNKTLESESGFKTYSNGKEIDSIPPGTKETKLERIVLLNSDEYLKKNSSLEDIKSVIDKSSKIFEELFKNSTKAGKIMIQFELKKDKNEIQFAVKDDIDIELMKEFEKRINSEKFPNSKKDPVKIQLVFKVNSFDDPE